MTTTPRKPGKKRIMVQVWEPIATAIARDFKALNIKRDRYLNDLLGTEIEHLTKEVTFCNSEAVRQRLQDRRFADRVKWTLELDEKTAARIDQVLRERNIPRDSFLNRVLFFLVAKEKVLKNLGVEFDEKGYVSAKPLSDAIGFSYDPFFHIRGANKNLFYTLCWFSDGVSKINGANVFSLNTAIDEATWDAMNDTHDKLDDLFGLAPTALIPTETRHGAD